MVRQKRFQAIFFRQSAKLIKCLVLAALVSLSLILAGCGGGTISLSDGSSGEIPGDIEPIPSDTIDDQQPPPWCDGAEDFKAGLPILDASLQDLITVEACIPGGAEQYSIEYFSLDPEQASFVKAITRPFDIVDLLVFFKIKDTEGAVVTDFDPYLELRVSYTDAAWEAIRLRDYEIPRVAYLSREGTTWGSVWIEFPADDIEIIEPGTEGYPADVGYLLIRIDELPDPLIGGC